MRAIFFTALLFLAFIPAAAQHGGKAEANRIEFAPGRTSATLTGSLKAGDVMEYVFAARAGQKVTVSNPSKLFGYKVFSEENFDEGDFDSSPSYTFEVPADGDYNLFVRRKVGGPRRATFRITLTIK